MSSPISGLLYDQQGPFLTNHNPHGSTRKNTSVNVMLLDHIASANQFCFYIIMSCSISSRLLDLSWRYLICTESESNHSWVSSRVQWGLGKMAVNVFVPQDTSFICSFSTFCRRGNALGPGDRVMNETHKFQLWQRKQAKTTVIYHSRRQK